MLSYLHDGLRTCSARGGVSAEGTWVQQKNVKISILLCIDSRLYPEGKKKKKTRTCAKILERFLFFFLQINVLSRQRR